MIWSHSHSVQTLSFFDGGLGVPGFCHDCLTNPRLPASKRMDQFRKKPQWQAHIQGHIDRLDDRKPVIGNP